MTIKIGTFRTGGKPVEPYKESPDKTRRPRSMPSQDETCSLEDVLRGVVEPGPLPKR